MDVRRTPTDHCPRALFRAYPLAPLAPRYPLTYSWECDEGIPGCAAGGLILRPVLSRVFDPAQPGIRFRVENESKNHPHPTHSPQATSTHSSREPRRQPRISI